MNQARKGDRSVLRGLRGTGELPGLAWMALGMFVPHLPMDMIGLK